MTLDKLECPVLNHVTLFINRPLPEMPEDEGAA